MPSLGKLLVDIAEDGSEGFERGRPVTSSIDKIPLHLIAEFEAKLIISTVNII